MNSTRTTPDKFVEDDTLHRLISLLLNEKNKIKSDKVHYTDKDRELDCITFRMSECLAVSDENFMNFMLSEILIGTLSASDISVIEMISFQTENQILSPYINSSNL